MFIVIRIWHYDIADLRKRYTLVVFLQDNLGENRSRDIIEFLNSKGVRNHFCTAHKQGQIDFWS